MKIRRWRSAIAAVAAAAMASLGVVAGVTAPALATTNATVQAGPFPVGNLLDYANSDFETAANFIAVTNVGTISDSTTRMFSHNKALAFTSAAAGTVAVKMEEDHTNGTKFSVGGSKTYTIGAYIRLPTTGTTTETAQFSLGQYDSTGTWIGWVDSPAVSLTNSHNWRYVEANVTTASNAALAIDSPKITITNTTSGQETAVDLLTVKPYRAAQAIGQHGDNCNDGTCTNNTHTDWHTSFTDLGSHGQTDKEFNSGALPSNFNTTNCYGDEGDVGRTNYSKWPLCIITYKTAVTSQSTMDSFLSTIPSQQMVFLVWRQEPEGDTFGNQPGCTAGMSDAAEFVCEDQIQGGYVHSSTYDTANVWFVDNLAGYPYNTGQPGADCSWIPAASGSGQGVDAYISDHYENGTVTGGDVNTNNADQWQNTLNCVSPKNKPIGFGEYGLDNSPIKINGPTGVCGVNSTNAQNVDNAQAADNTYLESLPMSGQTQLNGDPLPVMVWDYWYTNYGGTAVCDLFDNTYGAVTQWENIMTQNGGGA